MDYATNFGSEKPLTPPGRVDDLKVLTADGLLPTKSHADLSVLFSLTMPEYEFLFRYDILERARIPVDMRRLKIYTVRGVPEGNVGGREFHRIRAEIIFGLEGRFDFECEDVYGGKRQFTVDPAHGMTILPFMLHTYVAKELDSGLVVLCNTLYDGHNPLTRDTFSREMFRKLQEKFK